MYNSGSVISKLKAEKRGEKNLDRWVGLTRGKSNAREEHHVIVQKVQENHNPRKRLENQSNELGETFSHQLSTPPQSKIHSERKLIAIMSNLFTDPPISSTHSDLDVFSTSHVLVDFQRSFDEQIFPPTDSNAPVLEFEFQGARTELGGTVIDTRNIYMSLELSLEKITSGKDTAATIRPYFINNIAHSLWQNVEVFVAGTQVTNANNLYPFKSIVEADLSFEPSAKTGILACQGYSYEPDPTVFNKKEEDLPIKSGFNNRRDIVDARRPWKHWFTLNDSFLAGIDKYILPGFPLRIRLTRSTDPFLLLQPEGAVDAKNYTIKVLSASLFVHMLELRTETFLSIERALSKKAAQYDWREDVMVSFVITSGTSIYFRDDIFNRAPVSHLIMLMVPEKSFTGSYHTNPFHFSDFALDTILVTREGQTVGNTPIEVRTSNARVYSNTLRSLNMTHSGNGITLDEFDDHFTPVFRLTADLSIDDNTIRPELTGARLAIELKFQKAVPNPIRLILFGVRRSVAFADCNREVVKNSSIYNG